LLPCPLVLFFGVSVFAAEFPRQQINFNREWIFQLGDRAGAEAVTFATLRQRVHIPIQPPRQRNAVCIFKRC